MPATCRWASPSRWPALACRSPQVGCKEVVLVSAFQQRRCILPLGAVLASGAALLCQRHEQQNRQCVRRVECCMQLCFYVLPAGLLGELPLGAISMVGARRYGSPLLLHHLLVECCCLLLCKHMRFNTSLMDHCTARLPARPPARPPACSVEEARQARLAGADSILVKWEHVQQHCGSPRQLALLVEELRDATSGDD